MPHVSLSFAYTLFVGQIQDLALELGVAQTTQQVAIVAAKDAAR